MTEKIIREIYYYNQNIFLQSTTKISYVKTNEQKDNINAFTCNSQAKLIKQDGTIGGTLYANRNIQENTTDKTINSTNLGTITTEVGILTFMVNSNYNTLYSGDSYVCIPTFSSGGYLDKDVIIHIEVLGNPERTRKYTIFY